MKNLLALLRRCLCDGGAAAFLIYFIFHLATEAERSDQKNEAELKAKVESADIYHPDGHGPPFPKDPKTMHQKDDSMPDVKPPADGKPETEKHYKKENSKRLIEHMKNVIKAWQKEIERQNAAQQKEKEKKALEERLRIRREALKKIREAKPKPSPSAKVTPTGNVYIQKKELKPVDTTPNKEIKNETVPSER